MGMIYYELFTTLINTSKPFVSKLVSAYLMFYNQSQFIELQEWTSFCFLKGQALKNQVITKAYLKYYQSF